MSKPADIRAIPSATQRPLSAVELLVIGYRALSPIEQEEALAQLQEVRLNREAGEQSETERMLASLQRVRELVGHSPTVTEYRAAIQQEAREGGPGLESLSRLISHFGSWRMAREALDLSETNTARRIEARFANRRIGRVHQYTEETLRETVRRCAAELGRVPQVGEFKAWRVRELELARARGDRGFHLPGVGPYRARWGKWENVLRHFDFSAEEISARLERP
jgi:Homing endonuclease associated repeat